MRLPEADPTNLLATTALSRVIGPMTAAERQMGRYMRAPDGHDGGGDGAGDAGDTGADAGSGDGDGGSQEGADPSLMNGGDKAEPGEGEGDDASNVNDKDGGDDKGDESKAPELPEKYELTPPEGMEIDDALLAEADPVLRELGLSNDQANKLMPIVGKVADAIFTRQSEAFATQAADWAKQSKADKELGGKNWHETENLVAKALDTFAGPATIKDKDGKDVPNAFRQLLDETKLGNHPEMIRMFRKIGAALGEGGDLSRSDAGAPVKQDRLETLYPNDVRKEGAN